MTFTPETNPKVRALAREAAKKIKSLSDAHNAQLEEIYTDFRAKANAVQQEASTDSLSSSGADLLPDQTNDLGD
jgi:hypothetical protein